jgi:hypothetical protein
MSCTCKSGIICDECASKQIEASSKTPADSRSLNTEEFARVVVAIEAWMDVLERAGIVKGGNRD